MSKLIDYCLNITDGEHGTIERAGGSDYYLLSAKNLVNGRVAIFENDRKISDADFKKIRKRTKLEEGDVLLSTTGTIGNLAMAKDCEYYDFNRDVAMIKCDAEKLMPEYLYYLLAMPHMQQLLKNISKGGTQKHLYIEDLKECSVFVPSTTEQKKVVSIGKAIDDKIRVNNAINENLAA